MEFLNAAAIFVCVWERDVCT